LDSSEPFAVNPEKTTVQPAQSPASKHEMDRSLAHSLTWRAATNWFSQILSWVSLLIVARLLAPKDFGIAAMAVILWPYLRYLGEFGIPQTLVTLRDLSEDQLAQLNTIAFILGVGCFAISCVLGGPMAAFFRTPALAPVVIVTCSGLIPLGFRAVPEGLLNKEMRFGLLSWFEAVRSIVAAIATLAMAYLGWGYWSLVGGNLISTFVRSAMIISVRPYRFAWPHINSLREPLEFARQVMVSVVAWSSYERLDNATAGRVLGQGALGLYAMAWNLATIPLEKITSLVTTIAPSYLAAVQKEPAALRRYLRTLTETLALATFPATIGLALVARELVPLALGHKWEGAIVPLQVLSLYVALRSIVALLYAVLTAVGNPRFVMWNELSALVILPSAFYIGSHWGIGGIAWGWVAGYPLVALPLYWKTFKSIGMQVGDYLKAVRPALSGTLVMVTGVELAKRVFPSDRQVLLRLMTEIGVGVISYTATLLLLHRERILSFLRLAKSFRRPKVSRDTVSTI
jgi:O-antigen/teichoic acid export membrane protein